jgi:hypothetical protein
VVTVTADLTQSVQLTDAVSIRLTTSSNMTWTLRYTPEMSTDALSTTFGALRLDELDVADGVTPTLGVSASLYITGDVIGRVVLLAAQTDADGISTWVETPSLWDAEERRLDVVLESGRWYVVRRVD